MNVLSASDSRACWRLVALSVLLLAMAPAFAQDEDCLKCHTDRDALIEALKDKSRPVEPLLIDRKSFERSVHAATGCSECHFDFDTQPHPEGAETAACGDCHEEQFEQHVESLHGQALERGDEYAPRCFDCHTKHAVQRHTEKTSPTYVMNIPGLCGKCHHEGTDVSLKHDIPQDHIFENYSQSMHGEGIYRKGLTVTAVCTSCHTSHFILPHTDKRSSIHRDNVAATCTSVCHANIPEVHRRVVDGALWQENPETIPACVECHMPHKIRLEDKPDDRLPPGLKNDNCLGCHIDPKRVDAAMLVDAIGYTLGAHKGVACAQCHVEVRALSERSCETIQSKVKCSACHDQQVQEYRGSTHGTLHAAGDADAPYCLDCHDRHATSSRHYPTSLTFPRNVPELCGSCHREGAQAAVRIDADVSDIVGSYTMSIHGKGLMESGLVVTATCVNCHSAHGELPPSDPKSTIHRDRIADTCGKCHYGIDQQFRKSIHWPGMGTAAAEDLPTCKDCHTSHTISRVDQGDFRTVMLEQCGRCHEEESETYFDTMHGKFSRLGGDRAAKCYDCHGTHNILPVSDPKSTLGHDNVVATCGQCHTGSHRQFAGYLTHATHHDPDKYPWLFWTFWLMTGLLVGTLVVASLHTAAWLIRLWLTRDQWRPHKEAVKAAPGTRLYRRFTRYQRSMHLVMLISFFTLALTGMALKFSYMGWAQAISWMFGGFETMGLLHRLGAVALICVVIAHLRDVRIKKREAGVSWLGLIKGPHSILFNGRDFKEFIASMKWFLGRGPRPSYGRYTYWEKFDYFAVFWGVFVIGFTGLTLWFPEFFTRFMPGWFLNVATIIHSDEALLAVGFIFTIHFFNTHFRPDKFPMDPVIFTGRVPIEELKHDKPREYEEMVASGKLEEHLVDPFPKGVERTARIFGFVALGIGLVLIALIAYSMIFGYR